MKLKRMTIRGAYIYLIGVLILTARYPIVINAVGDPENLLKGSSKYHILVTPFVDYIVHFVLNPLLIPVFDWWKNGKILEKSFGIQDVLICFCFFIEAIVLIVIGALFMKTDISFINISRILFSPPYIILMVAFIGQMILFLQLRSKKVPLETGLKKLTILPFTIYGIGLLFGIFGILFILINPH